MHITVLHARRVQAGGRKLLFELLEYILACPRRMHEHEVAEKAYNVTFLSLFFFFFSVRGNDKKYCVKTLDS